MSVLINGAKPPSGCGWCYFNEDSKCALIVGCDFDDTNGTQRRKDCPIIELPDHGDLMDKDTFYIDLMDRGVDHVQTDDYTEICQAVYNAPVVIPAERSEDG